MTEKMLVTQGLSELKILDARIDREIRNAEFVACAKVSEANVYPGCTKADYIKEAKSSLDSVLGLIKRREQIKAAIIESNAKTVVEVCGEKITVAEAIDLKTTMQYRVRLVNRVKNQFSEAMATASNRNRKMEDQIDNLVTTAYGRENKNGIKQEDYDAIAKPYRASNESGIVSFGNVEKFIKDEGEYIEKFTATVDQVLQVSNCITFIEI